MQVLEDMNLLAAQGYVKPQRRKILQPLNEMMSVDLWGETIPFEDLTIALVQYYEKEIGKAFAGVEGEGIDDETARKIISYRCKKALAEAISAASMDFRVSTANKIVGKKGLIAVADGNIFRVTIKKSGLSAPGGTDEGNGEEAKPVESPEKEDLNEIRYIE